MRHDPPHAVAWLLGGCVLKRIAIVTLAALSVLIIQTNRAAAMQVGATPTGTGNVDAAKVQISQPSSFVNGQYGRTYWLGVTFPNGDFFQAGYLDASNQYTDLCQTGFATFVTGLSSSGQSLFSSLYNSQHCNLTGTRTFTLAISSETSTSVTWQWYMSGDPIGPSLQLGRSQDHFVRTNAVDISELVDPNNAPSDAAFPTVEYDPAIKVEPVGSAGFNAIGNATFVDTGDRVCHYALKVIADNDFKTGVNTVINPAKCYSYGDKLW